MRGPRHRRIPRGRNNLFKNSISVSTEARVDAFFPTSTSKRGLVTAGSLSQTKTDRNGGGFGQKCKTLVPPSDATYDINDLPFNSRDVVQLRRNRSKQRIYNIPVQKQFLGVRRRRSDILVTSDATSSSPQL